MTHDNFMGLAAGQRHAPSGDGQNQVGVHDLHGLDLGWIGVSDKKGNANDQVQTESGLLSAYLAHDGKGQLVVLVGIPGDVVDLHRAEVLMGKLGDLPIVTFFVPFPSRGGWSLLFRPGRRDSFIYTRRVDYLELVVDADEDLLVRVQPSVVLAVVELRILLAAAHLLLALDGAVGVEEMKWRG